ncbi:hypothetical protein [Varunaivibrio sulfuroxidans]|uniref:Uncharacterized protein n=1 Tax=Varunaivibrio sulfuroxidans TaxID=1773489 RepID=A0A4R3JAL2_9PROT|nr:hypothetical protein [Varunaivibrio sulfuroxidans]TCS61690.1 hypothetical protein EDD55_10799 [Varunaivibrio sulfuroxidans]WES32127.1 hypothetical protein P3M64_07150 [Varunaivibrio sulfuroxidans]
MAYLSKNLSVLAYANGFTLWHYTTADVSTDVDTTGYFNTAADMLRLGDIIMANTNTAVSPAAGLFVVRQNAAGVVDVTDMTAIGTANLD